MAARLGLLLALVFGAVVAYLTPLNSSSIRIALAPNTVLDLPLMAVVAGAFLAGVSVALVFAVLKDLGRSFRGYRFAREARTEARDDMVLALAEEHDRAGRKAEALATYRQILDRDRDHPAALRAIRRLTALEGCWPEALVAQEALVRQASPEARPAEQEWLAGIHYEIGKALVAEGKWEVAVQHFRGSVSAERSFLPALLAMGDACEKMGEMREAIRTWERAAGVTPALALLERLERAYREEGRPTRMIGLYQEALGRSPHDLALAFALGRVFFELEMLDEAAEQFQKVEVRAPDLPAIHAYLGVIFERRGQSAEAFEEYRRALHLSQSFEWPHACSACAAGHRGWQDRCQACGRWNTSRPSR